MTNHLWLAATLVLACGPQKHPDGETGESSGASDVGGSTSVTGDAPTTDAPSTTAGSSSVTGGESGEPDACGSFCARLGECELDGAFDGCPCDELDGREPMCQAAWQKTAACFEAASCAELDTGEGPCWELYEAGYEVCFFGGDGCEAYVLIGGEQPPGTCDFGEDCLDKPSKEVHCAGDLCTCKIGEAEVGTCPAEDVCRTFDVEPKIAECCA